MSHPNHQAPGGPPPPGYAYPTGYAPAPYPGYAPAPAPGTVPPGYGAPYGYAYPPHGYPPMPHGAAPPPGYAGHPPPAPTGYAVPPAPAPPGYAYPPMSGYAAHPQHALPPGYGYPYPPPPTAGAVPNPPVQQHAHIITNPPQAAVAPVPPKPTLATWNATSEESEKINFWFNELDKTSQGSIGGAEAVQFLKKSNLTKETLREIWSIVDSDKKGRLDRTRFFAAIRFLCILCNPMYAGSKPSLELFNNTITSHLPIPVQLEPEEADVNPFAAMETATATTVATPIHKSQAEAISAHFPETVVSAPLPELSPLGYSQPSSLSANAAYSQQFSPNMKPVQDEEDEEFSDFAGASTTAPQVIVPMVVAPNAISITTMPAVEEDDDFTDFQSTASPAPTNNAVVEDVFAGLSSVDVTPAVMPPAPAVDFGDDDEDFEGFQEATTPTPVHENKDTLMEMNTNSSLAPLTSIESNNSLSSMSTQQAPISSTTSPMGSTPISSMMQGIANNRNESNNRLSVFDDLVESDMKVNAEDWDDFAEANNEQPSIVKEEEKEIDLLAMDEEPVTITMLANDEHQKDDNFEFGDFEASPTPQSSVAAVAEVVVGNNTVANNDPWSQMEAEQKEEEFGNFGDFENVRQPVQNMPAVDNLAPAEDFGDFEAFETAKEPEPVEDNLLDFSSPAHINDSSAIVATQPPASAVIDLLDFLSDQPSFMVQPSTSQAFDPFAPAPSNFDANFAAFPATHNNNQKDDDDNFFEADFQSAFDDNKAQSNLPVASVPKPADPSTSKLSIKKPEKKIVDKPSGKVPVKAVSSSSSVAAKAPTTKHLTVNELQRLSELLMEKHFYDEAYDAGIQAYALQNIQRLMEEQQRALEDDDLEAAMKVKQEADTFVNKMDSLESEQRWVTKSKLKHKGETLQGMQEAISLFDESCAKLFNDKFVKSAPKQHTNLSGLVQRLKHFVLAKRSGRMITAMVSSHRNHPAMWKQLLQHVEKLLMEGNNFLLSFVHLNSSDQKQIKQQETFKVYAKSIIQVAEAGIYVATSCFECLVHESDAKKVVTLAQEVIQLGKKEWGVVSPLWRMTWQDVSLLAGKYSEQKHVVYCNISLRPLFVNQPSTTTNADPFAENTQDEDHHTKKKTEVYPHYTTYDNVLSNNNHTNYYYMKAILNLWTHDINKSIPESDGEFV